MKAAGRSRQKTRQQTRQQNGAGLIDALIALAILSFGILGMTRLQNRLVMQATESQHRTVAVQLSDELLNTALVDAANAACYTVPPAGACANATARARTTAWAASAAEVLPAPASAGAVLGNDGRLTVTLSWWGRESQEQRALVGVTDVRP